MTISHQRNPALGTVADRAGGEGKRIGACVILVDGHVHLHPNFSLAEVLDCAAANFRACIHKLGLGGPVYGGLLLAEAAGVNRFDELANSAGQSVGRWLIRSEQWPEAIVAACAGEPTLAVIAGRQIATREKLEVMPIGCRHAFGEGLAFETVLERAIAESRFCVVPWGFGKWTGDRGLLVKNLMRSPAAEKIYLGDNGGRLRWGPRPALFALAAQHGIPVLPGSDPFPFPSHAARIGSYGFLLHGNVDPDNLGFSIVNLIVENRREVVCYGQRTGTFKFVCNQFAMQVRKRILKPS